MLLPWALFLPPRLDPGPLVACVVFALLLMASSFGLLRLPPERLDRAGLLLVVPVLGALAVGATNYVTRDTSAAAQVFLVVPVLLGASQLRGPGALLATGLGVLVSGTATILVDPSAQGFTDAVVVGSAMVAVTLVLVRSGDRRERAFDVLHEQATADGLTGLLRRGAVDALLAEALLRGQVAVLMVDVDGFKQINDVHGHLVGDQALVHLADVVRGQVRHTDCVVGRRGGDELVMVLPDCTREGLAGRAADLVAAVQMAPLQLADGRLLPLTISVGGAHAPTHAADATGLYGAADAALYTAKRAGRDRFSIAEVTVVG
ncbi:diguanylate cyclase (GGDEF) domain-containing protein [Klenkia soli]|uniref:Diguanylate cyclase (GGDEF) domain-containing protein n=1 Tax=Klenkia soli TaxID=1052260 RepID=A0A1H0P484_9ACTN|nr:diguanylate cyclase (GGDEF) domain-containing protein [Klenkia soli]